MCIAVTVGSCAESQPVLTVDEACELLVTKGIHETFGSWTMRFTTIVWCGRNGQPEITVTIFPAAGQPGRVDADLMKSRAEEVIQQILDSKQWSTRYPRRSVQILP